MSLSRKRFPWTEASAALFAGALLSIASGCGSTLPGETLTAEPGSTSANSNLCSDFQLDVESVWSHERRAKIQAGMAKAGGSWGEEVAYKVTTKLDTFSRNWVMMKQSSCKDCLVRQTLPAEAYNRISSCLDTVLVRQATLLSVAESPSREALAQMNQTLEQIGLELQSCRDRALDAAYDGHGVDYASAEARGAPTEATAEQKVDQMVAQAKTLRELAEYAQAKEKATQAYELAKQHGLLRQRVDALVELEQSLESLADYEAAVQAGEQAVRDAGAVPDYKAGTSMAFTRLGWALFRMGKFERSQELAGRGRDEAPAASEALGEALNLLGTVQLNLGDHVAGIATLKRALEVQIAALGEHHRLVAATLVNLGSGYAQAGEYQAAVENYDRAQGLFTKLDGPDHPTRGICHGFRGNTLHAQGKIGLAKQEQQAALALYEKTLGPEHPRTAEAHQALSSLAISEGDYDRALEHAQLAVGIVIKVHGTEHQDAAYAIQNLAWVERQRGNYEKSAELATRAIEILELRLGKRHPFVSYAYNTAASTLEAQGRYKDALAMNAHALEIQRERLGDENLAVASTLQAIAYEYYSLGENERAREAYLLALKLQRERLGDEHPTIGVTLGGLAHTYYDEQKYEMAERMYRAALQVQLAVYGEGNPQVAMLHGNIAGALVGQQRYQEAYELYLRSLEVQRAKLGPEHPDTKRSLSDLEALCDRGHQPACR